MNKRQKVWVIVYRIHGSTLELLGLRPNPEPGRNTDYYVITGGIEENEAPEQAALREVKEEISVAPLQVLNLQKSISYIDKYSGDEFVEQCFAAQIDQPELVLNEEHIGYKWLGVDEFVETIWWEDKRDKLGAIVASLQDILSRRS